MGPYSQPGSKNQKSLSSFRRLNQVLLFVAALLPLALFLWNWQRFSGAERASANRVAASAPIENPGLPLTNAALQTHRLYPFSVIPGGARTEEQLKNALLHDPVAASHYADFDVADTHVIHMDRTRAMYVSYRIGNNIYWTSKRLEIPGGETVLSDGVHEARTRCGNRLSETPELPISAKEPTRALLEGPAVPLAPAAPEALPEAATRPIAALPEIASADPVGGRIFIPPFIPIWGDSGTPGLPPNIPPNNPPPPNPPPPTPPPVPTPEPSGLLLLSAGLFGIWVLRRKLHA